MIEDEEALEEERRKRAELRRKLDEEEAEEERLAAERLDKVRAEKAALLRAEEEEAEREKEEERRHAERRTAMQKALEDEAELERRDAEAAAAAAARKSDAAKSDAAKPKDEEAAAVADAPAKPSTPADDTGSGTASPLRRRHAKKDAGTGGAEKDAQDAANKEWNKSPKKAVEAVQANEPTYTIVNFNENTVFAMKHSEYCEALFAGLSTNTHVTEVHLKRCALSTFDMNFVAKALTKNTTIRVLDLENNKIDNNGAIVLAEGLMSNSTLIELNLLGQGSEFGDPTLTAFVQLFDHNITLTKVIWRLNSRKSFAINKLIVRNNTIKKWINEGKNVRSILPGRCNVADLSLLMEDGRVYAPKGGAEEPLPEFLRADEQLSSENLVPASQDAGVAEATATASATSSVVEEAEQPEKRSVGKLDADALFGAKAAEAPQREEKVVGKIDASAFVKREEEEASLRSSTNSVGREVGKLRVEEVFQPVSQIETVVTAADKPVEIGKLSVEARYKPTTQEVKPTVEKPEKIGKLNAAEKFKPVSQVEVKRTVEDLPTVGKLNLRAKGAAAAAAGAAGGDEKSEEKPEENSEDKAVRQPGKLDVLSRYKPPALAEAAAPTPVKEAEVGKINVAERYKVAKTEVASTVEKPEVKKMNVADRFKPVSQIEVKRAVEPSESVGKLQVGPIESQIEVVKQVPKAASLDDLIAHDSSKAEPSAEERQARERELAEKDAERERKAQRKREKAEAEAQERARLAEAAHERQRIEELAAKAHAHEQEELARARAEAEQAEAKQRAEREPEAAAERKAEAERDAQAATATARRSATSSTEVDIEVERAGKAAAEKLVKALEGQLEKLEAENAREHRTLQATVERLEREARETHGVASKLEQLEAENRALHLRTAEADGLKQELQQRLAQAEARVAQLSDEVAQLKAAAAAAPAPAPAAAAPAAAGAAAAGDFKSWKEFFLLAEVPEAAAGEYASLFEDAEIELSQALDLTKDELATLDVKLGHQMKILKKLGRK